MLVTISFEKDDVVFILAYTTKQKDLINRREKIKYNKLLLKYGMQAIENLIIRSRYDQIAL